jgi:hypothetical protein
MTTTSSDSNPQSEDMSMAQFNDRQTANHSSTWYPNSYDPISSRQKGINRIAMLLLAADDGRIFPFSQLLASQLTIWISNMEEGGKLLLI